MSCLYTIVTNVILTRTFFIPPLAHYLIPFFLFPAFFLFLISFDSLIIVLYCIIATFCGSVTA